MNRRIRVLSCSLATGILILGLALGMTCKKKNQPPSAPSVPSGPAGGRKGDTLRFSTEAEDPDGDSVSVRFDWGDSTMSDWSALVPNGDSVAMTHAWQRLGTYSIKAQAMDAEETASVWSAEHQLAVSSFSATFGGTGWDEGASVQQTSDDGFIIAGLTNSSGAGGYDAWLIRTDASGDKVWDKTLGGAYDDVCWSARQTADGGYIITGYTNAGGATIRDLWLIKTDSSGNRVWDKTFGGTDYDQGNSVQLTSDGYVVVGSTMSYGAGGHDVWLIRTDASGDKTWDKTFGGTSDDYGLSIQQTSDEGFIIAGLTDSYGAGSDDVWLIKTDASGNRVWDKTFGGTSDDGGYSVQQTSDEGYIIAGLTDSYGAGGDDVWLIKTDASGNKVWDRTFGGMGKDVGNSVQQTSDGGYVITGYANSYGAGEGDIWLIKTDADGK
jgi:predicted secreted protein